MCIDKLSYILQPNQKKKKKKPQKWKKLRNVLALGTGGGEEKQPKQIMDIQQNIVYILIAKQ